MNQITDNISTAEDPVEYNLMGINQVQIHEEIGLSFANCLRSFLRQDPDIIMVGEIRDFETAEIAIKAALTGHLVLSTLHTNDAPSTISRLLNMGIEPFLVASAVNLIVAQRLARKICEDCRGVVQVSPQMLLNLGVSPDELHGFTCYKGSGCPRCNQTGYKGRVALYEVLPVHDEIRELILQGGLSGGNKEGSYPTRDEDFAASGITETQGWDYDCRGSSKGHSGRLKEKPLIIGGVRWKFMFGKDDPEGVTCEKGEMEASNEASVRSQLRRQQILATKIQPKPKDILKGLSFLTVRKKGKRKGNRCLHPAVCYHDRCRVTLGPVFGNSLRPTGQPFFQRSLAQSKRGRGGGFHLCRCPPQTSEGLQ